MPATETTDFEREFEELVRDLRALPTAAPEALRARVRALGEAPRRLTWRERLPAVQWRKSLLVLAPACVLGLVAAAVIHGVVNSGPQRQAVATVHGGAVGASTSADNGSSNAEKGRTLAPAYGVATTPVFPSPLPAPTPDRYQDYEAWMTVRVKDLDALSDRTNEAMRVVRSYGGYVASLEQSTSAGQPGQASLLLRVPVSRVEDALMRLAGLGTVVERHLSIRDLQQVVQQQRDRVLRLRLFIARATEQLKGSLPADVRLRLQLQVDNARRNLTEATRANKGTLREASLSRVSLTLTTQKPIAAAKTGGMGRAERAARDAGSFLASAGAVLLFLLIVLSPVLVLVVLAVWGTRYYRRREEQHLLA